MTSTNGQGYPVFGKLGLVLIPAQGPVPPSSLSSVEVQLTQQGQVPQGTKSVSFLASSNFFSDPPNFFNVRINGTSLTLLWQPLPNETRITTYNGVYSVWNVSADVSVFAGQDVELSIETMLQTFPSPGEYPFSLVYYGIDEIAFSPSPYVVPDPPSFSDVQKSGARGVVVSWAGAAWLEIASTPQGPWQTISNASSPYIVDSLFANLQYYRLRFFSPIEGPP
jgi:hypothetical protein